MLFKVLLLLSLTSFIHGRYSGCGNRWYAQQDGIGLEDCEKKCFEMEKCDTWSYNKYMARQSCVFQKSVGSGCNHKEEICYLDFMYINNWKGTKNCGSGKKLCKVQYKTEMMSDNRKLAPHVNSCSACAKLCYESATCKYWNYVSKKCYIMESFSKSVKEYGGIGGNNLCGNLDSADCKGK